jgi:transcriptional regulator with GAF, ATPase, and Fis domain
MTVTRQQLLLDAFATLADTLVADYDVVELLQTLVETCQSALDVTAAGLLLADGSGNLDLVASTSEESRLVEVMQIGADAGPCIEAFRTGKVVSLPDITQAPEKWSSFQDSAREQGFASVYAIPMRLRNNTIGALNLFRDATGELDAEDIRAAQALADVATIGILQERALRASDSIREQLQLALNSRVLIEQAKGVLAYTHDLSMDEAFARLRRYARSNGLPLADVAKGLVQRTLLF